jgi:hypothetical protein
MHNIRQIVVAGDIQPFIAARCLVLPFANRSRTSASEQPFNASFMAQNSCAATTHALSLFGQPSRKAACESYTNRPKC